MAPTMDPQPPTVTEVSFEHCAKPSVAAGALVGPLSHVKERLGACKEAGVTHLQMGIGGPLEQKVKTVETIRSLVDDI